MSELIEMLSEIEGCGIDFVSQLQSNSEKGSPKGRLEDVDFFITYTTGEHLMLSVAQSGKWEKALDKLSKTCVEFMGADAICRYREEDFPIVTTEWDIVNPEGRLNEIINGGGVFARKNIKDLVLLNGREKSYYEDEDVRKAFAKIEADRIKNARIYGIDTGSIKNVEAINKMQEWELFLEYYATTQYIWRMNHDYSHGRIPEEDWTLIQKDILETNYAVQYLLYIISKKIDIEVSEPEVDKNISPDREMFMKWYRFYDKHFMNVLTDKQWREFETKRENGEDISEYIPQGYWRETPS